MFENIIGQALVVEALSAELANGTFPRAALFHGPQYSGKLSTALEAARVLTCRTGKADWACDCQSCRMQKELVHPYTVLMGARYAEIEIAASADALLRSTRPSTRFVFLRAVRKLLRRFDPVIWDAEDSRMRSVQERTARIEELLEKLPDPQAARSAESAPPGFTLGAEEPPKRGRGRDGRTAGAETEDGANGLDAALRRIIEECAELAAQSLGDYISIGQVRKLSAWAHLTAPDSLKVAIIENADRMQESARNALLKLLEEPPEGVRLILLSTRRSAIIPTVLSRLRPYGFMSRTPQQEQEVLSKIFRDDSGRFPGLRSFFLAWKDISAEELSRVCRTFLDSVMGPEEQSVDIVKELGAQLTQSTLKDKETVLSLLEEVTIHMQNVLRRAWKTAAPTAAAAAQAGDAGSPPLLADARIGLDILEEWNRLVREAQARIELFNVSPQAALESLYLQMRAAFAASAA